MVYLAALPSVALGGAGAGLFFSSLWTSRGTRDSGQAAAFDCGQHWPRSHGALEVSVASADAAPRWLELQAAMGTPIWIWRGQIQWGSDGLPFSGASFAWLRHLSPSCDGD